MLRHSLMNPYSIWTPDSRKWRKKDGRVDVDVTSGFSFGYILVLDSPVGNYDVGTCKVYITI